MFGESAKQREIPTLKIYKVLVEVRGQQEKLMCSTMWDWGIELRFGSRHTYPLRYLSPG